MPQMMDRVPSIADSNIETSDATFIVVIGAAPPVAARSQDGRSQRRVSTVDPLTTSDPADRVPSGFPWVEQNERTMTPPPESAGVFLSPSEAAFLQQIYEDLDGMPIAVRRSSGAQLCRRFAEGVGIGLARSHATRCAVFGDEEDGVTLLAHSRASSREVSFEFGIDEPAILIVSIDEDMRLSRRACGMDKVRTLAEAVAWLTPS